ncbi:MAG: DUF2971 domain-containing protein [Bacteroidales bacterium]|nr:DUF2971 domain-containing protein [Bacteroidales bacterium]
MGNGKLYKYLDADGGLMMLQRGNLQFTNATRLNDPFDCHPALFDFSHAPENPYNWPPKEFLVEKGETDTENVRNSAWICSLSKIHNSLMMWSYYGNHKGVCVGLDMEKAHKYLSQIVCKIFIGAQEMEVQYRDVIDKPDYFHNFEDLFRYQLSTKAKAWEHEQEVRLLLMDPSSDGGAGHPCYAQMTLPNEPKSRKEFIDWREVRAYTRLGGECFDSLYLGVKIEPEKRDSIIAEARACNPGIKIYQMSIDPDAFRLKESLINE